VEAGTDPNGSGDAVVPWWSFTKTILATAAPKLVESGRLQLDDPIADRPYMLRQLLQHRAGIPDYGELRGYHDASARRDRPWSVAKLLDAVEADRLKFRPGKGWLYSNVGDLFVRRLIEQTTRQTLQQALREVLFDDLQLTTVEVVTTASEFAKMAGAIRNPMIRDGCTMVY
jgi:CubicO group peptidase (beta-lactamase class C family)